MITDREAKRGVKGDEANPGASYTEHLIREIGQDRADMEREKDTAVESDSVEMRFVMVDQEFGKGNRQ